MDILHKILNWIDHNRYLTIGLVLGILASSYVAGCQPKVIGPISREKVTLAKYNVEFVEAQDLLNAKIADWNAEGNKLEQEVESMEALHQLAQSDYQAQIEMRNKVIETTGGIVASLLSGNPVSAAGTASTIFTLLIAGTAGGLFVDNRRKDKVILTSTKSPLSQ